MWRKRLASQITFRMRAAADAGDMSKSNKPAVTKTAVIAKAAVGESNTKIAEDLGISRPTVQRILSEAEFDKFAQQARSGVFLLVPKALEALERALDAGNVAEAKMILRNVGAIKAEEADGQSGITVKFTREPMAPEIQTPKSPQI